MTFLKTVKWRQFLAFFLMGIILWPSLVYALENKTTTAQNSAQIYSWLVLTITGAIGGFCYTVQDGELELPQITKNNIKLGFLADCIIGVLGAHVISPIVPDFNINSSEPPLPLTILTGLIGGYGGRTVINKVLDKLLNPKVNEIKNKVEEKQEELNQKVIQVHEEQGQLKLNLDEQDKNDTRAIELVIDRQFDLDFISSEEEYDRLQDAIRDASSKTRTSIFLQAKQTRLQALNHGDLLKMERTISVFEALLKCTKEPELRHRYHAQLAYVYKDKEEPSWAEAQAELTKAIEERKEATQQWKDVSEQKKKELDATDTFWFYEFNRAICLIQLDYNFKDKKLSQKDRCDAILQDLREASRRIAQETKDKIDMADLLNPKAADRDASKNLMLVSLKLNDASKNLVLSWLDNNNIKPTDLRPLNRASDH